MIKGVIDIKCSRIVFEWEEGERDEKIHAHVFDEKGYIIKELVFGSEVFSTLNLCTFMKNGTLKK